MAYFGFANKPIKGENIEIFNYGNCKSDFTCIDDIVEGIKRIMAKPPEKILVKMDCLYLRTRFII